MPSAIMAGVEAPKFLSYRRFIESNNFLQIIQCQIFLINRSVKVPPAYCQTFLPISSESHPKKETDADDCCFNIEIICGTIAFADAIEPDSSSIFSNVALYSSLGACAEAEGAAANNIATHITTKTKPFS